MDVPLGEETGSFQKGPAPGYVAQVEKDFFDVMTGQGLLRVRTLQLEGKKRMPVKDFLLGYELKPGVMLGQS